MSDYLPDQQGEVIPRPKILLVDDIDANLFAMRTLLRHVDAEILSAQSGNEALSLALDHQFALILLDVQMPGMDGFEVATFLRENPFTSEVPIVFMTASNTDELSQIRGYLSGGIDYVQKPVNESIVLSKVEIFLELHRSKQQLIFALKEVHRQRQILQATFDAVGDGVIATDNAGRISWLNPSAERMTGWDEAEAVRRPLDEVFTLEDRGRAGLADALLAAGRDGLEAGELSMLRGRAGQRLPVTKSVSVVRDPDGREVGGVIVFQDASQSYARELALIDEAETDPLTGLLNRAGFNRRLQAMLAGRDRRDSDLALLFGDLDRFKPINDRYGHAAGDAVLKEIALRMNDCVRDRDVLARWAGDEFAILMACDEINDARQMAHRLREAVARPIGLGAGVEGAIVGLSIGISMASEAAWDPADLLEAADRKLYAVKTARR